MGMSDTSSQVVAIFAHVHCEAGEELRNVVRSSINCCSSSSIG